jgi:hypothetical protein
MSYMICRPSRFGWLPCGECEGSGVSDRLLYNHGVPQFHTDGTELYEPCPSCNGVGWLPSPAVLEAMARAFHERYEERAPSFGYETRLETRTPWPPSNADLMREAARAAWQAQARVILEGEK